MRPSARTMIVTALVVGMLAATPGAFLWGRQEAFLFPARHNDDPVSAGGVWQVGRVEVPGAGRIAFRFADVGGDAAAPVLLFLHGNGSSTRFVSIDTNDVALTGLPIVAAEYPGYSGNPGLPSEASLLATAEATAAWARARWPNRRLAVLGESIGSAPAVHLAATGLADLLVIDSGFTSMTATIRLHVPWFPGVGWLNRHPMDNIAAIRSAARPLPPTLVMISAVDPVVPTAMGEELAAAIPCSTLFRSSWPGHAVLHGDPGSREVLVRWLKDEGRPACAIPVSGTRGSGAVRRLPPPVT